MESLLLRIPWECGVSGRCVLVAEGGEEARHGEGPPAPTQSPRRTPRGIPSLL